MSTWCSGRAACRCAVRAWAQSGRRPSTSSCAVTCTRGRTTSGPSGPLADEDIVEPFMFREPRNEAAFFDDIMQAAYSVHKI